MSLSLEDVQKVYAQSQGEPKLMIRLAGTYFADVLKLNNSFVNTLTVDLSKSTDIATPHDAGVHFDELRQVYTMLLSNCGSANSLSNATHRMLDSLKSRLTGNPYLLSTDSPSSLRFVLIVFENPMLLEPAHTKITRKLCRVVSCLATPLREILIQWFVTVGVARCRNYCKFGVVVVWGGGRLEVFDVV